MKVQLKLFALARQLAGRDVVELDLPGEATVGELRQALAECVPELARLARHVMFAIDAEYADDGAAIPAGAEVACIPPVSGG